MRKLDISHNQLEVLDDTPFCGALASFYAGNNKTGATPRAYLQDVGSGLISGCKR